LGLFVNLAYVAVVTHLISIGSMSQTPLGQRWARPGTPWDKNVVASV
jgi:hypothetical protein